MSRTQMVTPDRALTGRASSPFVVPATHAVLGTPLAGPWPEGTEVIGLALGCFWGAEKEFWQTPGVVATAAGYQGGYTAYPTYEEVCTGLTGHAETVLVAYDPQVLPTTELLATFWMLHDPTQGYRQGNDVGTQYRSAIYVTTPEQEAAAHATRELYAAELARHGYGAVTTEIRPADGEPGPDAAGPFYYAEAYHQQYLHKVPHGYCPVHSTGVACPLPTA
ncbi:peptide-methionine (S)-S-oxide reductase MsrA [Actinotalea fermentans]|uniref:Peptide methionine sulfoxide reductase MsrA n=1 Tax=Actinotalea fermentans TaxID=43671 RepID=A0A511YWV6_9CELL|nr:peptide-methionine (S)-S-oxide reductase MsrA [Actinotalea fermentans]KGM16604.1 peptide methionine sulfoxide reductase [Actinotalea fermentans ATCC 43279 = JCM 9966 = DSM 3133]GEN79672.1 peptide methionine sulfoxide reductase MsrA [Actinotalea fermentans]